LRNRKLSSNLLVNGGERRVWENLAGVRGEGSDEKMEALLELKGEIFENNLYRNTKKGKNGRFSRF